MSPSPGSLDAFRDNSGSSLYMSSNRTPTSIDYWIVIIIVSFLTIFISFLVILPGFRKAKLSTFIVVVVTGTIGFCIGIAYWGSSWHVGEVTIQSQYRAGSALKLHADVGVFIGLRSVNITYKAVPDNQTNDAQPQHYIDYQEINFDERFFFDGPTEMKAEHETAKAKGLPYAILTITEYLSKSDEGFCWGFQYRKAGYYAANLLIISMAVWITMLILLCAVPRYAFNTMILIGLILLFTVGIYSYYLPDRQLTIPFEEGTLTFKYGWSYWSVLGAGVLATLFGIIIFIKDYLFLKSCATILEVDYDTPYKYCPTNDAHVCKGDQRAVSKQMSDASVSTIESYPVDKFGFISNRHFISPNLSSSSRFKSTSTAMTTTTPYSTTSSRATSSKNRNSERGKVNDAFDGDEKENNSKTVTTSTTSSSSSSSVTRATGTDTGDVITAGKDGDQSGDESNNSEVNEISTDIVHGKRAVSLHNFGRFTEKQKRERDKERLKSSKSTTKSRPKSSEKDSDSNQPFSTHL